MKVIKMRPSHQPVIGAMIKVYGPQRVVECGCGPNSTPIWSRGCKSVIGIEHNPEWVEEIKDKCGANVDFVTHVFQMPLGNPLTFGIYPHKLSLEMRQNIYDWYVSAGEKLGAIDLLFVDSFAATRVYSLMALAKQSGIIMYHDTEVDKYWYSYFERKLPLIFPDGFKHVSYRPRCRPQIVRQEPCTDIIFKPEHYDKIDKFVMELEKNHREYYWAYAGMEFVYVREYVK
jgi:hypothetical protein